MVLHKSVTCTRLTIIYYFCTFRHFGKAFRNIFGIHIDLLKTEHCLRWIVSSQCALWIVNASHCIPCPLLWLCSWALSACDTVILRWVMVSQNFQFKINGIHIQLSKTEWYNTQCYVQLHIFIVTTHRPYFVGWIGIHLEHATDSIAIIYKMHITHADEIAFVSNALVIVFRSLILDWNDI